MCSFSVKDVYDYLRAIIKTREKSERALDLTKDAASLNPANYTVWQYRLVMHNLMNFGNILVNI